MKWHDAKEKPAKNSIVLVRGWSTFEPNKYAVGVFNRTFWTLPFYQRQGRENISWGEVEKWAYVEDDE